MAGYSERGSGGSRIMTPLALLAGLLLGVLLTLLIVLFISPQGGSARTITGADTTFDSTLILTDAFLTTRAKSVGLGPLQDARLHVKASGTIELTGRLSLIGPSVPVTLTVQPVIVDGDVQVKLTEAQFGLLSVPQIIVRQIEDATAVVLRPPPSPIPVTVVRVETREGELFVYSKIK